MSYQFSFLQPFVGYHFLGSKLLTTSSLDRLSKSLQVGSLREFRKQIEIKLRIDIVKYQRQINCLLRFFWQISLYLMAIDYRTLADKCLNLTIDQLVYSSQPTFLAIKKAAYEILE